MNLAEELTQYMNESQARGNKVMSIDGLRAIIQRHSPCDCVGGAYSTPNAREDANSVEHGTGV